MGRHEGSVQRGRIAVALAAAAAVGVLGVGGWQTWSRFGPGADGPLGSARCSDPAPVRVTTTPAMRDTLETIARSVTDVCATYTVVAEPAAVTAKRFAGDAAQAPQVWVPDSPQLAQQAAADAEGVSVGPPIAFTPLVIAVPEGLKVPEPVSWGETLAAEDSRLPDPDTSTVGSIALMMGMSEVQQLPDTDRAAAFNGLSGLPDHIVSEDSLFAAHAVGKDKAIFPTTEQQVEQAHVAGLTALPAQGETPPLEYSLVSTAAAPRDAVGALSEALASEAGQQALRAAGFRTATNTSPVIEGGPPTAAIAATASPEQVRAAQQMWQAITLPTRLLIIVDTSGSMSQPAAKNLGSRIEVAAEAASTGIPLLDDNSAVGLWMFSTQQRGSRDWTQLQPVRELGQADQRSKLSFSLGSLGTRLGGDTGLYDTVDAAYATALKEYDPKSANLIALFTDGVNDDPAGGISLATLRARLKASADPKKPITVFLIGMGSVDGRTLGPVVKAIPTGGGGGGAVFTIRSPEDISNVYVKMMLRRLGQ